MSLKASVTALLLKRHHNSQYWIYSCNPNTSCKGNQPFHGLFTAQLNSTENDKEENVDSDFEPLYPGSSVSVGTFMLLLAVFTSRYNLIGDATEQLLKIISFVLPAGHNLCSTLQEFKKFF